MKANTLPPASLLSACFGLSIVSDISMMDSEPSVTADAENCALSRHLSFLDSEAFLKLKEFYVEYSAICIYHGVEGNGMSGDVYKGTCCLRGRKVEVAVKKLRLSAVDDKKRLFAAEVYVWSKLDHPNLLKLLGFSFEKDSLYPLLISDWKDEGNALRYVEARDLTFKALLRLLLGIAEGLEYLHHGGPRPIIHSDLKPQNVLIDGNGTPMIGDFGSARIEAATQAVGCRTASFKGTDNYRAFELLHGGFHTMESDMWAFGMTVYALTMKEAPYAKKLSLAIQMAISQKQLPAILDFVGSFTQPEIQHLRNVFDRCCDFKPTERMSAKQIVSELQNILDAEDAEDVDPMELVTIKPISLHLGQTQLRDSDFPIGTEILSRIKHFNLSNDVVSSERHSSAMGAFSDVLRGQCRVAGRGVVLTAMKRLRIHLQSNNFQRLLEQEIYVWSKLKHPNVLPLLGFAFEHETGYPILISDWMEHGNVLRYVRLRDPSSDCILVLIADVAKGLSYLHSILVIHSDIKPENVLIGRDGEAMICDFGCARMEAASVSIGAPTSSPKGTSQYLSPEVINGSAMSKSSDVWAFGMTIYAMLTRKHPFGELSEIGAIHRIANGTLPVLSPANDAASLCLQNICRMCWKTEPEERPCVEYLLSCITAELTPRESTNLRRTLKEQIEDVATGSELGVPVLVERCIEFIEDEGMKVKNLYSDNGESAAVETVMSLFERREHASLDTLIAEGTIGISSMTDVLRLYLSLLPEPLLTFELHNEFLAAINHIDTQRCIIELLRQLPPEHFDTLEYLMQHLCRVLTHARRNHTSSGGLASIFGPILMRARVPCSNPDEVRGQIRVTKYLIENALTIFSESSRERT